jgi:hypothetical protein
MVYLQISLLGGSHDETWREQGIRKCSVSWNLPTLSQLWRCNGGFGLCTTQNHLWTKQYVSGTWNSSRIAACVLQNKQAGQGHRPRLSSMCEKRLSGALRSQHIVPAGNCRCLSQVFGAFCANVFMWKDTGCSFCRHWILRITVFIYTSVWITNSG